MLTIAISKGRIYSEALPLLAAAGVTSADDPESSRKLVLTTNHEDVRLLVLRAQDVPTFVEHGEREGRVIAIADVSPSVGASGIERAREYLAGAGDNVQLIAFAGQPRAIDNVGAPGLWSAVGPQEFVVSLGSVVVVPSRKHQEPL